jgi:hypothetical protein
MTGNKPRKSRSVAIAASILRDRQERIERSRQRDNKPKAEGREREDVFQVPKWRVVAGGDPGYLPSTPTRKAKAGFVVACRSCGREFESKGLAYCTADCKRKSADREANETVMAEAGIERSNKRKCECGCGREIPKWRNGKRVPKSARFYEPKCQWRAAKKRRMSVDGLEADFPGKTAKNINRNGPSRGTIFGPSNPPINLVGGYRFPDAPKLDKLAVLAAESPYDPNLPRQKAPPRHFDEAAFWATERELERLEPIADLERERRERLGERPALRERVTGNFRITTASHAGDPGEIPAFLDRKLAVTESPGIAPAPDEATTLQEASN